MCKNNHTVIKQETEVELKVSDMFLLQKDSSSHELDTDKGYIINITDEAILKSRNGQGGDNVTNLFLIVSLLNETLFRVSSSSDTEVLCLSFKALLFVKLNVSKSYLGYICISQHCGFFFFFVSFCHCQKGNDTNESDPVIHGQNVLGVWLGAKEVQNLSQPVQLRFRNRNQVRSFHITP